MRERDKYDLSTVDGKTRFLTAAADILSTGNAIVQDAYASKLAAELSVGKDAILSEIKRSAKRKASTAKKEQFDEIMRRTAFPKDEINPDKQKHPRAAKAEEALLKLIMHNPDFYPKLCDKIDEGLFITDFNRRVYRVLSERLNDGRSIDLTAFTTDLSSEEMGRITMFSASGDTVSNTLAECDDCIKVLKEEKSRIQTVSPSEMSDEEFLNAFKKS